jgi:hypothetical protein
VQSRRSRLLLAVPAIFVALFVFTSLTTTSTSAPATRTASRAHEAVREATPAATIASATAPLRRILSLDSHIGAISGPQSLAVTILIWAVAALSFELLLLGAGLGRRGRAPPLARA